VLPTLANSPIPPASLDDHLAGVSAGQTVSTFLRVAASDDGASAKHHRGDGRARLVGTRGDWTRWQAFLKAVFGLPTTLTGRVIFRECTVAMVRLVAA
jgi:hypothetical protein